MTFYILILDDVYILKWQAFVFPRWSCIPWLLNSGNVNLFRC
jgi:hypothetical protein